MSFTSITSASGRQWKLQVADNDVSPSSYQDIGGQRSLNTSRTSGAVDITSVTSPNGDQEWDPDGGIASLSCTVSGIMDSQTAGAQALQEANTERTLIDCRLTSGHGDFIYFTAVVATFDRNGEYTDVEMFSASLNSHGRVLYVAAP